MEINQEGISEGLEGAVIEPLFYTPPPDDQQPRVAVTGNQRQGPSAKSAYPHKAKDPDTTKKPSQLAYSGIPLFLASANFFTGSSSRVKISNTGNSRSQTRTGPPNAAAISSYEPPAYLSDDDEDLYPWAAMDREMSDMVPPTEAASSSGKRPLSPPPPPTPSKRNKVIGGFVDDPNESDAAPPRQAKIDRVRIRAVIQRNKARHAAAVKARDNSEGAARSGATLNREGVAKKAIVTSRPIDITAAGTPFDPPATAPISGSYAAPYLQMLFHEIRNPGPPALGPIPRVLTLPAATRPVSSAAAPVPEAPPLPSASPPTGSTITTVFLLRFAKLLEVDDGLDAALVRVAMPVRARLPPFSAFPECYTTLEKANGAARRLQIEFSHRLEPVTQFDLRWQQDDRERLMGRLEGLAAGGGAWASQFNGLGGERFEIRVEAVGLCGPRDG
ncbi:hypothetical protein BDV95DRAFT_600310 [Massariosphaeria phaeospora]|uniref:Uncharacterized protein n=1 Tax=Massariosphaeria phaeospora TaxID=100035 RepID=A0A7C8M066_9PLEO|nr:hypothetical protein BDV95DRAFT_600310 [Massariosphaeria phaeospora]